MKKRDFYFWEPELNPHTRPLYRALAAREEVNKVVSITDREQMGSIRRGMGWAVATESDGVQSITAPGPDEVERLVRESDPDSVHVFLGMHWIPSIVQGQRAAAKHGRHFGIMSEPRVLEGAKGVGRLFHSWATEAVLRRHPKVGLAVGRARPTWFRRGGYGKDRVFNFAYFLHARNEGGEPPVAAGSTTRVACVGRLERVKGVALLLDAIPLMRSDAEMHFVGPG